ncbi:MAG: NG,NG-dimethylarginine dimethylaminohydrolase 1 [Candidatus Saccharicenans subterraneus]|uniref:NG,NG-dimethylarginine dimethylaminohydrolase 1 n=1 Tax=Candidatus Saccharicenans subterraneus TaxID=2508984 RepID=A0A3E2BQU5_9BACT|nr:MAG: NG,NG-dimethylarginine dimethylaminohydrolase 1 [Candidatus Saccharicenans subterraneum]
MVGRLTRVVVKRPAEAFISAEKIEREWRQLGFTAAPDLERASQEFSRLEEILRQEGVEILYLPADERTTLDSIYTHDPVLITDAGAIILQMGKRDRAGEPAAFEDALKSWSVPVLGRLRGKATAEGGDLLWLDEKTLIAGRGFRTNQEGIEQLQAILRPLGVQVMAYDLPYWNGPGEVLHLMSFISLLDTDLAVVYKRLLPVAFYWLLLESGFQLVEIPEEEFPTQGCNVLAISPRRVVILEGNPITAERLLKAGCFVHELPGQEIAFKGSGGPTCLTRPLIRL